MFNVLCDLSQQAIFYILINLFEQSFCWCLKSLKECWSHSQQKILNPLHVHKKHVRLLVQCSSAIKVGIGSYSCVHGDPVRVLGEYEVPVQPGRSRTSSFFVIDSVSGFYGHILAIPGCWGSPLWLPFCRLRVSFIRWRPPGYTGTVSDLCSYLHLWLQALGTDQNNDITYKTMKMSFLWWVTGLFLKGRVSSLIDQSEFELLLCHIQRNQFFGSSIWQRLLLGRVF